MNTLRKKLISGYSKGLFKLAQKSIVMNNRIGYYTPKDIEDYVEDLKTTLPRLKPEFLCIYFTNQWNPVSIRGEKTYENFVMKSTEFTHLKIDVDKFPKLKWYFDSKFEPGCHLYHYGNTIKNVGGINFEKTHNVMKRAIQQVRNDEILLRPNEVSFSQPYYSWEAFINQYGHKGPDDYTQQYVSTGFKGFVTFTGGLSTDDKFAHVRIKK